MSGVILIKLMGKEIGMMIEETRIPKSVEDAIKNGTKFGKLRVTGFSHFKKKKLRYKYFVFVRCDCGKEKVVNWFTIKYKPTISCGCTRKKSRKARIWNMSDDELIEHYEEIVRGKLLGCEISKDNYEDAVQDCMLRLIKTVRRKRPSGMGIYTISYHVIDDICNRYDKNTKEDLEWIEPGGDLENTDADRISDISDIIGDTIDEVIVNIEQGKKILSALSERELDVFVLRNLDNMNLSEIGRVKGLTPERIRQILERAELMMYRKRRFINK